MTHAQTAGRARTCDLIIMITHSLDPEFKFGYKSEEAADIPQAASIPL